MPDKPGDAFKSGGYRYTLGKDPSTGKLRPYYTGKADDKKGGSIKAGSKPEQADDDDDDDD